MDRDLARLTVCVGTYNQERYIADCLQSIVDQKTSFPFEIIVADDCSTDGTRAVIEKFASQFPEVIRPIFRPRNIGATSNYLELHNSAASVYVSHIDGDDLMLPGKLQRQVEFLDANPEFAAVWHRVNLFDDEGRFMPGDSYDLSFFPDGNVTIEHAFRLGFVGAHSSLMYRRECRKTREAKGPLLDLFFTWELLSQGKGKMLQDVLGEYRVAAQGSIQVKSMTNILNLVADHARHYLELMPEQRQNIFVLAVINFLVDVKHRRSSAMNFGKLALQSFSFVSPQIIRETIKEMQRMPNCSPIAIGDFEQARSKTRGI